MKEVVKNHGMNLGNGSFAWTIFMEEVGRKFGHFRIQGRRWELVEKSMSSYTIYMPTNLG